MLRTGLVKVPGWILKCWNPWLYGKKSNKQIPLKLRERKQIKKKHLFSVLEKKKQIGRTFFKLIFEVRWSWSKCATLLILNFGMSPVWWNVIAFFLVIAALYEICLLKKAVCVYLYLGFLFFVDFLFLIKLDFSPNFHIFSKYFNDIRLVEQNKRAFVTGVRGRR